MKAIFAKQGSRPDKVRPANIFTIRVQGLRLPLPPAVSKSSRLLLSVSHLHQTVTAKVSLKELMQSNPSFLETGLQLKYSVTAHGQPELLLFADSSFRLTNVGSGAYLFVKLLLENPVSDGFGRKDY